MSDQQNFGGSNIRLMMGLIAAGEVALVGGGYTLYSYFTAPSPEVSSVNLTQVGSSVQLNAPEQQDYRERLRESNAEGALAAAARNTSFIASIPLQHDVVTPKPVTAVTSVAAAAPPRQQQASGRTPEQEKPLRRRMQSRWVCCWRSRKPATCR